MSLTLSFQIELESDYHISAGHGLGATVDSALLRDAGGAPVIRGTTLVGLLRDSLWRLLQTRPFQNKGLRCKASGLTGDKDPDYCGQFNAAPKLCPVCRLIGTPRQPKRWFVSSARPVALQTPGAEAAQVVQRARISPRTRRAEARKLFSQEEGQARTFAFSITTHAGGQDVWDEAALWVAAARNVRQLGRSRRRGQGECLISLVSVDPPAGNGAIYNQAEFLQKFVEKWLIGEPALRNHQPVKEMAPLSADTNGEPRRFRVLVRADEPLIIARRAEAGNQFETLSIITGQALRGALAWRAARRFGLASPNVDPNSEVYRWFRQVFLRGGVTFPMLYPAKPAATDQINPAIPAPRNWLTCKTAPGLPGAGHGLVIGSQDDAPEQCQYEGCISPLKPLDGFILLDKAEKDETGKEKDKGIWQDRQFQFTPLRHDEMHVRINPETNRADPGMLFSYAALEAGQYFTGELVCATEADWLALQELTGLTKQTPFTMRIGKASRRGYGQITLWLEEIEPTASSLLIGRPLDEQRAPDPADITLTLLSDTIVTDAWGRFMDTFSEGWLSTALGLAVNIIPGSVTVRSRIVDGFNAHQGLPRWRDLALSAGSAVRLKLVNPPDDWRNKLANVEWEGIGLRRNEGFGRVAFNPPVYIYCENIQDSYRDLPEALRLSSAVADNSLENWQSTLDDKDWTKCRDARFTAVARWLNANAHTSPETLMKKLGGLGAPDGELKQFITDYGDRDKENKLQKEHGAGVKLINSLLQELNQKPETIRPVGIRLLAQWVAAAVPQKGAD